MPGEDATPTRIDRARLAARLHGNARGWAIEVVEQTTSTNADLLEILRAARGREGLRPRGEDSPRNVTDDSATGTRRAGRRAEVAEVAGVGGVGGVGGGGWGWVGVGGGRAFRIRAGAS